MKLFISWSGEPSKSLALALRDWVPLVLHYVDPWLSEADIKAGEPWGEALAKELEAATFGLICVTRENIGSTWLHFEAGAIAKSMTQSRVVPLLLDLGVRDLTGPLSRFQAKKVERTGVSDVVESINDAEKQPVPGARVKELFDALWPRLEERISSISMPASTIKHSRPQPEILEELVASVRSLDSRISQVSGDPPQMRRHRRFRFHPFMMRGILDMLSESPDDQIGLLILASTLRDEIPWLYELGVEAYRAAKSGPSQEAQRTLRRFRRAVELCTRGPFGVEELGLDPRTLEIMRHELENLLPSEAGSQDDQGKGGSARGPGGPRIVGYQGIDP